MLATSYPPRFVSTTSLPRSHTSYQIPHLPRRRRLVRNHIVPCRSTALCPARRRVPCVPARCRFRSRAQPLCERQADGDPVVGRGQIRVSQRRDTIRRHAVTLRGKETLGIHGSGAE